MKKKKKERKEIVLYETIFPVYRVNSARDRIR
jgi:hypothetical protein